MNLCRDTNVYNIDVCGREIGWLQSSWCKGISETKSKQQSPCSNWMRQPVTSCGNACSMCIHQPVMHRDCRVYYNLYALTSKADACTYCMGSKVSSLSWIYLSPATLGWLHRYRRCKNRLLKFVYVPATSTAQNRLLFFAAAVYSTNEKKHAPLSSL